MWIVDFINRFFTKKTSNMDPEFGVELVVLSHKIKSTTSKPQLIKIKDKYYRVRELG